MSAVEICKDCRRLFPFLARGVCGDCLEAREREYARVRDWVRGSREATVREAAEATGVARARIAAWVVEGRLELTGAGEQATRAMDDEQRTRVIAQMATALGEEPATPATDPAERYRGMQSRRDS